MTSFFLQMYLLICLNKKNNTFTWVCANACMRTSTLSSRTIFDLKRMLKEKWQWRRWWWCLNLTTFFKELSRFFLFKLPQNENKQFCTEKVNADKIVSFPLFHLSIYTIYFIVYKFNKMTDTNLMCTHKLNCVKFRWSLSKKKFRAVDEFEISRRWAACVKFGFSEFLGHKILSSRHCLRSR